MYPNAHPHRNAHPHPNADYIHIIPDALTMVVVVVVTAGDLQLPGEIDRFATEYRGVVKPDVMSEGGCGSE